MEPKTDMNCIAFTETKRIARGPLLEVVGKVKKHLERDRKASVLIFDDRTSAPIEVDLRGPKETVLKRLKERLTRESPEDKPAGPGRPRLGVVSREVSLLPRHWEWLASQPEGASAALRKLVEEARKQNAVQDEARQAQEAAYKFMSVMAGNLPGYEEALRAFYARKKDVFEALVAPWPKDIREHVATLSSRAGL